MRRICTRILAALHLRPRRMQVAALCCRDTPAGREVLLITSRDTGRWVLPKGWPMHEMTAQQAALQEAWEEAGVRARPGVADAVGRYAYDKRTRKGRLVPVDVLVFEALVTGLADDYPEVGQRNRAWVTPHEAARRVDEPGLRALLRRL